MAARERHIGPVSAQTQHIQQARENRELHASANQGKPPIAATARPGEFSGHEVVSAKKAGAPYHPPANPGKAVPRGENNPRTATHPKDLPPFERPAATNTGDANRDREYQQQQDKMFAKQEQERQKLQQKQEEEHQRMERQKASQAKKQQMEDRHQQQTQQLQQRQMQEQQRMQEKQRPEKRK